MRSINLKPTIFQNQKLGEADPVFTLLFIGLMHLADDKGHLEDRPKRIRAEVFPYQPDLDIEPMLKWLKFVGLIDRISDNSVNIISIKTPKEYKN